LAFNNNHNNTFLPRRVTTLNNNTLSNIPLSQVIPAKASRRNISICRAVLDNHRPLGIHYSKDTNWKIRRHMADLADRLVLVDTILRYLWVLDDTLQVIGCRHNQL